MAPLLLHDSSRRWSDFIPSPLTDGLHLTAPDGSSAVVRFNDFAPQNEPTEVWGNHFTARVAPEHINQLAQRFFLLEMFNFAGWGRKTTRRVKRYEDVPLSFADGFPIFIDQRSLIT